MRDLVLISLLSGKEDFVFENSVHLAHLSLDAPKTTSSF